MPEKESSQFEEESRVRELRRRIATFQEARAIEGGIDDMSEEQFEEMVVEVVGVDNDLGVDSIDIIEAMIDDEGDEGFVREPRRPIPGSDAGALALEATAEFIIDSTDSALDKVAARKRMSAAMGKVDARLLIDSVADEEVFETWPPGSKKAFEV